MGFLSPFWVMLCLLLIVVLTIGVILTIVGIIKYSEDKKDRQLMVWGIVTLLVPIIIWGIVMTFTSDNFVDLHHESEYSNMMDY